MKTVGVLLALREVLSGVDIVPATITVILVKESLAATSSKGASNDNAQLREV
jgi:hypothetical protein